MAFLLRMVAFFGCHLRSYWSGKRRRGGDPHFDAPAMRAGVAGHPPVQQPGGSNSGLGGRSRHGSIRL